MLEIERNLETSRGLLAQAIRNLPLDQADKDILASALETGMKQVAEKHAQDAQPQPAPTPEPTTSTEADPNANFERERAEMEAKIVTAYEAVRTSGGKLNIVDTLKQALGAENVSQIIGPYSVVVKGPDYFDKKSKDKSKTFFLVFDPSPNWFSSPGFGVFYKGNCPDRTQFIDIALKKPTLCFNRDFREITDERALINVQALQAGLVEYNPVPVATPEPKEVRPAMAVPPPIPRQARPDLLRPPTITTTSQVAEPVRKVVPESTWKPVVAVPKSGTDRLDNKPPVPRPLYPHERKDK